MKSNTVKAILILLIIVLSEGFEVRNRGKINTRSYLNAKWKSNHRSAKKGRHSTHHKSREICQKGFGFAGSRVSDLPSKIVDKWKGNGTQVEKEDIWINVINPIIKYFAKNYFDFVMGDYDGKKYMKDLGDFLCPSMPIGDNNTVGVLGINLTNLPCGSPTTVKICLMFDQCGTFGISMNSGIITCLTTVAGVALAGIGAVLAQAFKVILTASIAFSYHGKLGKKFQVLNINITDKETPKLEIKDISMRGHLHAALKVGLPLSDMQVGDKKLSDYISLDATFELLFDFGNVIETVKGLIDAIKNSSDKTLAVENTLKGLGMEFSIRISGSISLKLKNLTKGFLPNLSIGLPTIDSIFTTGGGASGLDPGFYFRAKLDQGKSIIGMANSLSMYYAPVTELLDIPTKLKGKLDVLNVSTGFMLSSKGIAGTLESTLLTIKCFYSFELGKGSCEFGGTLVEVGKIIFTGLYNGGEFLLLKVKSFFSDVGKAYGVCKEYALDKIEKGKKAAQRFLKGMGLKLKAAKEKVSEKIDKMSDKVSDLGDDIDDWFEEKKEAAASWWSKVKNKGKSKKANNRRMRRFRRRRM